MNITRETLELAARAAGLTPVRMSDDGRWLLVAEQAEPWRPNADLGDAARLALHLNIDVRHYHGRIVAGSDEHVAWGMQRHDGTRPDRERAFCEAITECAAEIGRRMRDPQLGHYRGCDHCGSDYAGADDLAMNGQDKKGGAA